MKVVADYENCMASGNCVAICPSVFAQGDDGIVKILDSEPADDLHEAVEQAVMSCPSSCLAIEEV